LKRGYADFCVVSAIAELSPDKKSFVLTFVVDEADMTMDMGFLDTVDKIAASLPKEVQKIREEAAK